MHGLPVGRCFGANEPTLDMLDDMIQSTFWFWAQLCTKCLLGGVLEQNEAKLAILVLFYPNEGAGWQSDHILGSIMHDWPVGRCFGANEPILPWLVMIVVKICYLRHKYCWGLTIIGLSLYGWLLRKCVLCCCIMSLDKVEVNFRWFITCDMRNSAHNIDNDDKVVI